MDAVHSLAKQVGTKSACRALAFPRASLYRQKNKLPKNEGGRPAPPLALTPDERQLVLDTAHSQRFWDTSGTCQ